MWIAAGENGLVKFNTITREQESWVSDDDIINNQAPLMIYIDRSERIWIGTFSGGLFRYDPQTEQYTPYIHDPEDPHSISSNTILSVFEDYDGEFWIAGSGGLDKLDPKTGKILNYREEDGLPNNVIYGILADIEGNLWLSTNEEFRSLFTKRNIQKFWP